MSSSLQNTFETNRELVYLTLACAICGYLIISVINKNSKISSRFSKMMKVPYFRGSKKLSFKDELILNMLETTMEKGPCFVITDPSLPDNPIVYASPAFCDHMGYKKDEVEGRNCRFLQGAQTSKEDVKVIRDAIDTKRACSVCLLNYRKNGSTFVNQFFLTPLFEENTDIVAYYLGVQAEVPSMAAEKDKERQNPGYKIFQYFRNE